MANTVERKIYFYRVDAGLDEDGDLQPFNPVPSLEYIDSLAWNASGRYWIEGDGKITCCWVDDIKGRCKIRLGNIRRRDLPQVERYGSLTPLGLPDTSGLAEQTHIVFFEDNIVGCDFNYYGPRITKLAYYLSAKAIRVAPPIIHFEPLLRHDIAEQLDKIGYLKIFKMKIRAPFVKSIATANRSLAEGFEAAINAGGSEEVEIILTPAPYSKGRLSDSLLKSVRRLVKNESLQHESSVFNIEGFDTEKGEMVTLDLLSDKLIAKKSILKLNDRTKALDTKSAYTAIESAHTELSKEFGQASGVLQ